MYFLFSISSLHWHSLYFSSKYYRSLFFSVIRFRIFIFRCLKQKIRNYLKFKHSGNNDICQSTDSHGKISFFLRTHSPIIFTFNEQFLLLLLPPNIFNRCLSNRKLSTDYDSNFRRDFVASKKNFREELTMFDTLFLSANKSDHFKCARKKQLLP